MKKSFYLLMVLSVVISCTQLELDELLPVDPVDVSSRATISVPDVIRQLDGIPVNIINIGNSTNKYLSCGQKDNSVNLHLVDNGSLRQRFYIKYDTSMANYANNCYLLLVGGNSKFKQPEVLVGLGKDKYPQNVFLSEYVPSPIPSMSRNGIRIVKINGMDAYYFMGHHLNISTGPPVFPLPPIPVLKLYLQPQSHNSTKLVFDTNEYKNSREKWQIVPVEDFELLNIRYFEEEDDKVSSVLKLVKSYDIINRNSSTPLTHRFNVKEEVTESANFSTTSGINITNKTTSSNTYSSPEINQNNTVSTEVAFGSSWTYQTGTSQTTKIELTEEFVKEIPAYTNLKLNVYIYEYTTNISYVGEFRANKSGKIIKLKGKYKGKHYSTNFKYEANEY